MRLKHLLTILSLPLATTTACSSSTTGLEGNLRFSYAADDDAANFNKPIAKGAFLELTIRPVEGGEFSVTEAAAAEDDAALLEVTSIAGNKIVVKGLDEGEPLLEVTGLTEEGEELNDAVNLLVRVPEVLKVHHTCHETNNRAAYLTNQRAWLPFELEMSNELAVIGYGYYPVVPSDETALSINTADSSQRDIAIDLQDVTGEVTLDSEIDDTSLTFNIVTESQIDGVQDPVATGDGVVEAGGGESFVVRPLVGEDVLCQAFIDLEVTSETPEICTVETLINEDWGEVTEFGNWIGYEYGHFTLRGVSAGECLYTVTYPNAGDGSGVSRQLSITVDS